MIKRPQLVKVLIRPNNIGNYKQYGYECSLNKIIEVDAEHLSRNSKVEILIECDYCGSEYLTKQSYYYKSIELGLDEGILKSCCDPCNRQNKKLKEVLVNKHGFKPLPSVKFKQFEKELLKKMRKSALKKVIKRDDNTELNESYLDVADSILSIYEQKTRKATEETT